MNKTRSSSNASNLTFLTHKELFCTMIIQKEPSDVKGSEEIGAETSIYTEKSISIQSLLMSELMLIVALSLSVPEEQRPPRMMR